LEKPVRRVGGWTGNVWKAIVQLRTDPDLDIAVLNADWGVGVVFTRPNTDLLCLPKQMDWDSFQVHKNEWLRVMEIDDFLKFLHRE